MLLFELLIQWDFGYEYLYQLKGFTVITLRVNGYSMCIYLKE